MTTLTEDETEVHATAASPQSVATDPGGDTPEDTLAELLQPVRNRALGRLPFLIGTAVRLTWKAGRGAFLVAAGTQLIGGVAVLGQLLLGRDLLQRLVHGQSEGASFTSFLPVLAAFTAVSAVIAFTNQARVELQRLLSELVSRHATGLVMDVASTVDLITFETSHFHNRLLRAMVNATNRPVQMTTGLLTFLSACIAITGVAGALFVIQPALLAAVLLAYVPVWLTNSRASRVFYDFSVQQTERDRRRQYLSFVLTDRAAAAEIRAFRLAAYLRGWFDRLYDERLKDLLQIILRRLRYGLAGGVTSSMLSASIIAGLVWMVAAGRLDLAAAGAAAGALLILSQRLQALAGGTGSIYESSLFLEDFASFVAIDGRSASVPPIEQEPSRRGFDRLSVRNVRFRYPSRTEASIDGLSLEIRAGEVVALVGENGSGKTTLAKLLAGLYVPDVGSIRWDGTDMRKLDPSVIQASVGVIFQDFAKYFLTAAENIGLGEHSRIGDRGRIVEAARRAGADDFLFRLHAGYDTPLGTQFAGATELSGGQWQRVAIARAFFRDAPFLILDEPSAALDPRSEAELFERIRTLYHGRTVLLISHRFSTVRSADRIFVLDKGRIVESGSHAELMELKGLYAEMFTLQASAYLE